MGMVNVATKYQQQHKDKEINQGTYKAQYARVEDPNMQHHVPLPKLISQ